MSGARGPALRQALGAGLWGLVFLWAATAQAHVASNGFLAARVSGQDVAGSVELALRDVELAVGVDADRDGKVTWGELQAAGPAVAAYVRNHVELRSGAAACELEFQRLQVNDRVDGAYAWLPFTAHCPVAVRILGIRYSIMDGIDPSHRGLLTLTAGGVTQTGVVGGPASAAGHFGEGDR